MNQKKLATVGGGCFWCVEACLRRLNGVHSAINGYAGGSTQNPTYKQICTGQSGHAEVVQVSFNPEEISYLEVLKAFFKVHDPTQLNRQGHDVGTQYRSVIYYHDEEQKEIAQNLINSLNQEVRARLSNIFIGL